ncbi:Crp/Fnr family transcriptional regulator [Pararhodonellum marinum]|uniref:Crp/Fnr family transcriptional regulator n=1 Tax=Pararhodonellum marinum TaxID=2755358 RepID=UPI001E3B5FBE|nr:Crp/Fnr family transcriptional regulator [Pararhodonellum marinum]
MYSDSIIKNFRSYVDFQQKELDAFFDLAHYQKFKKNEMLFESGPGSCPFILIKSGCLMTYFTGEKDFIHVIQFGIENWWTGDLNSFMQEEASIYSIKAMANTEVYILGKKEFESLCAKFPNFEKYFRILFQNSLVSHQKRIIRNISFTAEEKYLTFTQNFGKLELILPQKYIASYLGITPEFLSMIRRKLAGR